jgi:spoIIIJ-associated protein
MSTTSESDAAERPVATAEQLEQEGDIAADYLEALLDIADIDGDLALDVRAGRAYVSVENDDADALRLLSSPTRCRRCRSSCASLCRRRPVASRG